MLYAPLCVSCPKTMDSCVDGNVNFGDKFICFCFVLSFLDQLSTLSSSSQSPVQRYSIRSTSIIPLGHLGVDPICGSTKVTGTGGNNGPSSSGKEVLGGIGTASVFLKTAIPILLSTGVFRVTDF